MNNNIKEWTVLLYANGHNELEPETWQSVVDIQHNNIGKQINVVVQVSREERAIVKLLRPNFCVKSNDEWHGVRRYVFSDEENNKFQEIENINMADPQSLYDFIIWGVSNYPAQRYMISVSGHIYQFVGICPDYSGNNPYMMGFPELSCCIQQACTRLNKTIDILILDTCYAATFEILYEFGRYDKLRIRNILTYIGKGPLAGLPYANVLSILNNSIYLSTTDILKMLVNNIAIEKYFYGLIAFCLDYEKLKIIKQVFSNLALTYLSCKRLYIKEITPEELLSLYHCDYPWSLLLKPLHNLLKSLIIISRHADNASSTVLPIHILYQKIPDQQRRKLYSRLSFAKQNYWASLLCDLKFEEKVEIIPGGVKPLIITKNILTAFIYSSNGYLPICDNEKLVNELIKKKQWNLT